MIGTWTPPGAIFTVQFDDEKLELKLIKRTEIPHDEPISWMAFDVSPEVDGAEERWWEWERVPETNADTSDARSTPRRTCMAPP